MQKLRKIGKWIGMSQHPTQEEMASRVGRYYRMKWKNKEFTQSRKLLLCDVELDRINCTGDFTKEGTRIS